MLRRSRPRPSSRLCANGQPRAVLLRAARVSSAAVRATFGGRCCGGSQPAATPSLPAPPRLLFPALLHSIVAAIIADLSPLFNTDRARPRSAAERSRGSFRRHLIQTRSAARTPRGLSHGRRANRGSVVPESRTWSRRSSGSIPCTPPALPTLTPNAAECLLRNHPRPFSSWAAQAGLVGGIRASPGP
jgi:hypothetical protein